MQISVHCTLVSVLFFSLLTLGIKSRQISLTATFIRVGDAISKSTFTMPTLTKAMILTMKPKVDDNDETLTIMTKH